MRRRQTETESRTADVPRLEIHDLSVRRGGREVLNRLSLSLAPGEVLGLLGPNGAGKSSALHAISGLIPAQGGEIALDGEAMPPGHSRLRERTGVVFQDPALDGRLGARTNLRLAAALQGVPRGEIEARVSAALEEADLPGRGDDPVKTLSGGQRRRVELARAAIHDPDLLLMDEPTSGLDEASSRRLWVALRERTEARGVAVLLTTHREREAERCDRLAVLHEGRIVACETPEALRARVGGDVLELRVEDPGEVAELLRDALDLSPSVGEEHVRVVARRGHELIPRVVEALPTGALRSLTVHGPELADAYLALTGHGLEGDER